MIVEPNIADLQQRERELLAELADVKARLGEQGHIDLNAARTTPVGRDELFSAVEKTRMPMILTDPRQPDDPIVFVNRAFLELSGYTADELLGRNCRFLQGPDTDPAHVQSIRDALATNQDFAIEILNYRRDGSSFLNELYISPVFDADGALLYRFGSQLDITGYGKARRDLEASERRQRAILDSSVDFAIIVTDRDGRVTDWNAGAEHILGWSAREMLGQTVERIFTPEDREAGRVQTEMRGAVTNGRSSDERWHLKANGSRFFASGELMPLRDRDGTHSGYIKILRDRTREHEAGQALRRSEESLLRAQEVGGVGLFTVPLPDGDLKPSPEFCRLYGLPVRESYPTATIERCVVPEDAGLVSSRDSRHRGEIVREVEYRIRRADTGELRWIARIGEIERDEAGRPVTFSGIARDVTEQRSAQFALQTSEAHWRGLFEKLDEGFVLGEVVRDAGGRVVDWRYLAVNPAWGRMVDTDTSMVIGHTVRELIPGIEDAWVDEAADVVETGMPSTFLRQVGALRQWYEGHVYRIEGDRFAVVFTNVTERRDEERRRAALLELSDRLRDEADPAAMTRVGAAVIGRTLDIERVGYGTVEADVETFRVEEDWTASDFPSLAGHYRLTDYGSYAVDLREGRTVTIADVREDPRTAAAASAMEAIRVRALVNLPVTEGGRTVAILYLNSDAPRSWSDGDVAFARDVAERLRQATERRRAEQELRSLAASLERQVEERTRERDRFWRLSRDPLLVADAAGRWVAVSPAWTEILGWSETELLGQTSEWMEHPEDRAKTRAEVDAIAQGTVTLKFENRFRTRNGDYRWFSWTAVPTDDGLLYAVARDITEQKAQVEAQAKLEDQLRQSQKMEAVGQLTGGIAHDFNNMLAAVIGSLNLIQLRLKRGDFAIDRFIDNAMEGATRAASLTQRLLAFSRQQPLMPQPVDVNRLIGGMTDLLSRSLGETVQLQTVQTAGQWKAKADPNQLENVLLNLAVNARDAMPAGGRLTIEVSNIKVDRNYGREAEIAAGEYVVIAVSDTGTGMPPEVVARIFDPFFTTKGVGKGTGLGLSQVFGFARQSNGAVRVYSEVGHGTTFRLYLPRFLGDEPVEVSKVKSDTARGGARTEIVLVVEDEVRVRANTVEALRELGYTVLHAENGPDALARIESGQDVTLLFTDIVMPDMTGRQLAERALALRPKLKVLYTTGYARDAVVHNGTLDPGTQFLAKPFSLDQLAAKVREVIDG